MKIESILDFWFGTNPDDAVVAKEQAELWWSKNRETDDEMRQRFEESVSSGGRRRAKQMAGNAARAVGFDYSYRSIPAQYLPRYGPGVRCDSKALAWCLDGIDGRSDRELRPIERVFFYLRWSTRSRVNIKQNRSNA